MCEICAKLLRSYDACRLRPLSFGLTSIALIFLNLQRFDKFLEIRYSR